MYTEIVRTKLIAERNNAGYTQEQLANAIGVQRSLISKIEAGFRQPDIETVGKIAEFYGISVDWFFGLGTKTQNIQVAKRFQEQQKTNATHVHTGKDATPKVYFAARDGVGFEQIKDAEQARIASEIIQSGKKSSKKLP